MAAHKINRKTLRKDGFVDKTAETVEFLQEHYMKIGIAVLAIIVIAVGSSMYSKGQAAGLREASDMLFQGQTHANRGNFPAAIQSFEECIGQHGGTDSGKLARVDLGLSLLAIGNIEGALASFDVALGDFAGDTMMRDRIERFQAVAMTNAGRHGEAVEILGALYERAPMNTERVDLALNLALALQTLDRNDEAIRVLEEVRAAIASGALVAPTRDLDNRIAVLRALAS